MNYIARALLFALLVGCNVSIAANTDPTLPIGINFFGDSMTVGADATVPFPTILGGGFRNTDL